jgi:hypothetical protein
MAQPHIHPFYRLWFTWIDPLTLLLTSATCFFNPLLHQISILYLFMGIIFPLLMRASRDPQVWRIVQAAILGVDVACIATMFVSLGTQGRLWRGLDSVKSGFTVWVAGIRIAYLAGVGSGRQGRAEKSK